MRERDDGAEAAIVRVLSAERGARASIEQARAEVQRIDETARADVRRLGERTERRIRCIAEAFDRDLAARLRAIDAEAGGLDASQPLGADEREGVQRAVAALALQLVGALP